MKSAQDDRLEMFTVILARDACGLRLANMTKELRAKMSPVSR